MKKEVAIPEGVTINIDGYKVAVTGPLGTVEKDFSTRALDLSKIRMKIEDNKFIVESDNDRRKIKAMVGTIAAHVRNMINGVTKGYEYKLKIVYSHFPITVELNGNEIIIKNFFGEKKPRKAKIKGDVKVEIKGKDIIVSGINLEDVSQTAANIEQATRLTGRDRRIFYDGIYVYEKGLKE